MAKKYKRRKWTEKDIEILQHWWGTKSINQIAKILKRSPDAVASKAQKLGLGGVKSNLNGISLIELQEIVGRPWRSIRRTWVEAGLKVYKCGRNISYTTEEDLHEFMKAHPNLWDARECDYYYFYTQPWFLEALENERNGIHAKRYRKWSEQEKSRLIYMREVKCMYFSEIAKEFGMTEKNAYKSYKRWKGERESA